MKIKTRVAVIFGGTNTEHEVSLVSAKAVIDNLDKNKYEIIPIKITKENIWLKPKELSASYQRTLPTAIVTANKALESVGQLVKDHQIDVVFPVLHGPYGEDGTIQGMLELMRLPYVGCGVAASAICMDKVLQKDVCQAHNIPTIPYFSFSKFNWQENKTLVLSEINDKFSGQYPLFVKPVNQGSSVGITKAHSQKELVAGIELALTRDLKVIIEKAVENVREIECGVLGDNQKVQTSVLGEIIASNEFYDYNAKYLDGKSSSIIPAKLSPKLAASISSCAKLAFQVLDCSGLARIDFLLDDQTGEYYLNELNTMPGFTPISMYPKLWEASGVSYQALLDKLICLALERHQAKMQLNFSQ